MHPHTPREPVFGIGDAEFMLGGWNYPMPNDSARDVHLLSAITVTDFDRDGDDELVLTVKSWLTPDSSGTSGQLWIYRGGEDFRLDSLSVMLRTGHEYGELPYVVRLDDDPYSDLALHGIGKYPMRVLWGTGRLPEPSDTLQLINAGVGPTGEKVAVRIDGDDVDDVVGSEQVDDVTMVYRFYLTGSGKPPRTRPYGNADYDIEWRLRVPAWKRGNIGPLADTPGGREMIALMGMRASFSYFAFGGDGRGIDTRYDAWSPEPNFNIGGNLDANDDGWQDVLLGSPHSNYNNGVVVILAGGPYIPRDSLPAGAVRDVAAEGHVRAVSLWPNPATTEVNIAWRGDLRRMPERIVVHDDLGRLVAEGRVLPGVGAARWDCTDVARGHYHLSVLDSEGRIVASASVVLR